MVLTWIFIHHLDWKNCLEFWLMGSAPFQAKCLQNHCESDPSQPLVWERPNNYGFGEVAQLEEWHLHLRAYDVWLFWHNPKTSCHLATIECCDPKGRWTLTQRGSTTPKKCSVSKTAGKTSTELGSQPRDIQIATESVASICKLCCTPERSKEPIILSSGSLNCPCRMLLQVLIFSKIPLRSQVVRLLAQLRQRRKRASEWRSSRSLAACWTGHKVCHVKLNTSQENGLWKALQSH